MPASWRHRHGLASWSYDLLDAPEDLRRWLRETTVAVAELMDGFAVPIEISPTTEAQGDRLDTVSLPSEDATAGLQAVLAGYHDLIAVRLSLALLLILEPGGPPRPWPHGASLLLDLDEDREGNPYLHIRLSLDVDIYVQRTYAEQRDNHVLAHENGPRLRAFLRGLQRRLGATVSDVAAVSYPEQITADGFRSS